MKRKLPWLLVILVLLSAAIVMLWPTKLEVRPRLEMSFLWYSNGPVSPEVVFAVHNPPTNHVSWKQIEVEHWEFGTWQTWYGGVRLRTAGMQLQRSPLQSTVAANGKPISHLALYQLPDTNDSWRIRTHIEEMRPLSFIERLTYLARNRRQANGYAAHTPGGFSYWITNEVGPPAIGK